MVGIVLVVIRMIVCVILKLRREIVANLVSTFFEFRGF